ncbi:MAG: LysR family transcriptional regulator [Alphaproteobacteria bacterium]
MKEKLNHRLARVTLRQLRALQAVLRTGTTKGAAEALHVTPPAITLQLRELEGLVGVPLLERRPDGVQPTAAGAEIQEAATRIETLLADTADMIETLRGLEGGKVAVGVISTAKYFAPMAIAAFAREHPEIDLSLKIGNREETIRSLQGYEFDFAIMGRPPSGFAVDAAPIGDHPHVIIAPPHHALAGSRHLALQDLVGETFLLREPGSGTRSVLEELFAAEPAALASGMEIGSNETIKQAVIAGLGIALISAHTVAAELAEGRLILLDVEGLPVVRTWYLVKRADKRLLPAADAMWRFLSAQARAFLPPMAG